MSQRENYKPENLFRSQKRGGGVLLFIRNGIEYKRRTGLDILLDKIEAIFIEKKIGKIYRPPNICIESFIEYMNSINSTIRSEHKDADFLGDYNIDLLNSDSHPLTAEFLETMYFLYAFN